MVEREALYHRLTIEKNTHHGSGAGDVLARLSVEAQPLHRGWMEVGALEGVDTPHGIMLPWGELASFAMGFWSQGSLTKNNAEALGADLAGAIPDLLRLADLEVRIPCVEILALHRLAERDGKSVDAVLSRELLDVVSAHFEPAQMPTASLMDETLRLRRALSLMKEYDLENRTCAIFEVNRGAVCRTTNFRTGGLKMLACLLARLRNTLQGALAWIEVSLVALVVGLVVAIVTSAWLEFGVFAFILGALVVSAIITAITIDVIMCAVSLTNLPPPAGGSGSGSGPLTSAVDCPTAQSSLADAKARMARLQFDIDAQAAKVRAAQDAVANARTALTVATAALGASFFFPWAIPAAAAAVAASVYAATRAARSLEAEVQSLQQIAAQLSRAQRDVSANEVVVTQSCGTPVVPGPTAGGITVGALRQLAGVH